MKKTTQTAEVTKQKPARKGARLRTHLKAGLSVSDEGGLASSEVVTEKIGADRFTSKP